MRLATPSCAAWLAMLVSLGSCTLAGRHHPGASTAALGIIGPTPLVLAASEGERRVRRLLGGAPLIIKIDRLNGAAPEFVMGYVSNVSVRFIRADVALAHVINEMSGIISVDGAKQPPHKELSIRVFVKDQGVWRITAFHNTILQN
jgi:hypothetical protein